MFFCSDAVIDGHVIHGFTRAISLVRYGDGSRDLGGHDLEFAMWFYQLGGVSDMSEALVEGDQINVIGGPLMNFLGTIVCFDRNKKKAWISLYFMGQDTVLSVSVDEVTKEALIVDKGVGRKKTRQALI